MANAFHFPVLPKPRFSLGKVRGGAVACLCLWASAGFALAASPTPDPAAAAATAYRQASESFNHEDYDRALDLLDHAPEAGKPGEQADVWNLRGAIYLHQRRYDKARAAFAKAAEKDPGLWAARFNLAEIHFRQGKYTESSKEFEELLGRTSRWTHSDEHGFLQYKLLLTDLLAGKDKPVQAYLGEHRGDRTPPLAYYYLNAALEHHRGHGKQAEAWLTQADAHYTPANEEVFAESFRSLNWDPQRSERLIAAARHRDASSTTPANMAVVELLPGQTPAPHPAEVPVKNSAAVALPPAATPPAQPAFRTTAPSAPALSADGQEALQMPPPDASLNDLPDHRPAGGDVEHPQAVADAAQDAAVAGNTPADPRAVYSQPIVLGRPSGSGSKAKATPAPSPAATAESTPAAAATPEATATPSATVAANAPPKPEFTAKYEQAYIQFLQKNYAEARKLLDEADAIQPGQTTSVNLRGQIFKHFYESAYAAYKQRADYSGAIAQLDEAEATQPNQPDALNLRGLTYSKLKDYEHAESAFKRAITADPQFWAARFNYAELPFNYRNYTAARSRFEELSAQTDSTKQPREVELTQFKIFLTLLLEGKVDGARSFMGHLAFTGKTPARYFCQAALEFYGGSADGAQAEIDSAAREFQTQPKLVDIFKESFYRIGWLNDPGNPATGPGPTAATPGTAVAEATPPAAPADSPVMATTTPAAAPSPEVALATPATAPAAAVPPAVASLTPAAATPPVVALNTPAPSATPAGAYHAKPSKNEDLVRLVVVGFVLINIIYNSLRLVAAVLNHQPRQPVPVRRSPLYARREEDAEQADEVEAPR